MMTSSRWSKRSWKALKRGLGVSNRTVSERGGLGRSSPSYQQQQYIAQLPDSYLTFGVVGLALSIDAEAFRCCLIVGKQEEHSTPSNNSRTVSIELVTVAGSHCVYFLNSFLLQFFTRHAFLLL